MGIIKDMFFNFEKFFDLFINFDYSRLFTILMFSIILFLIHFTILNLGYKRKIKNISNEMGKINLETTLNVKKRNTFFLYFYLFLFMSFIDIVKGNLFIVIPVITTIAILIVFSIRTQLNNIFLGMIFKTSTTTTVYEGMEFYFKEMPNESFKVVKINLFKVIIKNTYTGKILSIENSKFNSLTIIHKPLEELDYVDFKLIFDEDAGDFEEYIQNLELELEKIIKRTTVNYTELRKKTFGIKTKLNTLPFLKPFYKIKFDCICKGEIEIYIFLSVYEYNKKDYVKDFMNLKQKKKIQTQTQTSKNIKNERIKGKESGERR